MKHLHFILLGAVQALKLSMFNDTACETPLLVPGALSGQFNLETDKCLSKDDGYPVNAYLVCGADNHVKMYSFDDLAGCEAGSRVLQMDLGNECSNPDGEYEAIGSWKWDCTVNEGEVLMNFVQVTMGLAGVTMEQFLADKDLYMPAILKQYAKSLNIPESYLTAFVIGAQEEPAMMELSAEGDDVQLVVEIATESTLVAETVQQTAESIMRETGFELPGLGDVGVSSFETSPISESYAKPADAEQVDEDFTPPEYEVSTAASFFHSFPRLNGADATLPDPEELQENPLQAYTIGVAIWVGIYILIAVSVLIAFFCAGVCDLCRVCANKENKEIHNVNVAKRLEGGAAFWFFRLLYIATGVLAVGTCYKAYSDEVVLNNMFDSMTNSIGAISDWSEGLNATTEALGDNIAGGFPVIENLLKELPPTCPEEFDDTVNGVWEMLNSSFAGLLSAPALPIEMFSGMEGQIESGQDASGMADFAWLGVGGVAAFLTFVVLLYTLQRKHDDCCALKSLFVAVTWLIRPVGLVVVVLLFIVSGLILPMGIILGDICDPSPTDNLIALTGPMNASGEIEFVATCNAENSMIGQISGMIKSKIPQVSNVIEDFSRSLRDNPACVATLGSPAEIALVKFEDHWAKTEGGLNDFADGFGCSSISPIYTSLFYDTMCNAVPGAIYHYWMMFTLAGYSTTYLLWKFHTHTDTIDAHAYESLHPDESDVLKEDVKADEAVVDSV